MSDARILSIVDPAKFVVSQNSQHNIPLWWACPTTLSRRGERLVGTGEHGLQDYGAWCLLVGYMATRKYRWTLTDSDGKPLTLGELEWRYRLPRGQLEASVNRLLELGWLKLEGASRQPLGELETRTNETNETNKTNERAEAREESGDDPTRWMSLAGQLRIGPDGLNALRSAVGCGVLKSNVYSALRDQIDSRKHLTNATGWAIAVARRMTDEACV